MTRRSPQPTHFPYTTLSRSETAYDRSSDPNEWTPRSAITPAASTARNRPGTVRYFEDVSSARAMTEGSTRSLRSEEHTSELQSRRDLVCRLLLEKKKLSITS